ncbi:MAG: helix-turn-helix domain-containing protein [Bacteroidales bacterium]|nr:helix-turn-helix domain-containing protein [Bacteroidales bacterium]
MKTTEQKREEYKEVFSLLRKGYSVRNVAKLSGVSVSTVQRIKREFTLSLWIIFRTFTPS